MTVDLETAPKHLDWRTMMSADADAPKTLTDALDAYFEPFAQPERSEAAGENPMLCLKCREPLTGMFASMFGKGGFEWGMAHGEGRCRCCGWPARAMHYVKDDSGKEVLTLRNFVLQYHPDVVSERSI